MNNRSTVKQSLTIHSHVSKIFEAWSNLEDWTLWTPTVEKIIRLNNIHFDVGTKIKIYQPKLAPAVWKIVKVHPGQSFIWETKSPGLNLAALHLVEPAGSVSKVTVELKYSGFLSRLAYQSTKSMVEIYIDAELKSLKHFCEHEQNIFAKRMSNLN